MPVDVEPQNMRSENSEDFERAFEQAKEFLAMLDDIGHVLGDIAVSLRKISGR